MRSFHSKAFSLAAIVLLTFFVLAAPALAADGDLDTTFDGDGIATQDLNAGSAEVAYGVTQDEDGNFVITGFYINGAIRELLMARFNPNGSLDTSFSGNGWASLDALGVAQEGRSVLIQPDNRILTAGWVQTATSIDFFLVRYMPNGTLDTSFSGDGWRRMDVDGGDDLFMAHALLDSGLILASGQTVDSGVQGSALVRFRANGSTDTSFAANGVFFHDMGDNDAARNLTVLPDGRIVLVGYSGTSPNRDAYVMLLDEDGALDTSFDTDGITELDMGGDESFIAVLRQPDGKLLVAGGGDSADGTDLCMSRYLLDGSLDPDFGTVGTTCVNAGGALETFTGLALQDDRRILACGLSGPDANNLDFVIARFEYDGDPDTSFGTGGLTVTDEGDRDVPYGPILGDDTVTLAGHSSLVAPDIDLALLRYESSVQDLADSDFDGVDDDDDDYPEDSTRATVTTATGTGKFTLDVSGVPGAILEDVQALDDDDASIDQTNKPGDREFRDGMVGFTVKGIPWGATIEVEITCPTDVTGDTTPYHADDDGFADFSANSAVAGNVYTLTLTDGGDGDGDNEVNGEIVDPFGPAWPESSSSGGGCAFGPESTALPWLLVLLVPMALLLRRRA